MKIVIVTRGSRGLGASAAIECAARHHDTKVMNLSDI